MTFTWICKGCKDETGDNPCTLLSEEAEYEPTFCPFDEHVMAVWKKKRSEKK